VISVGGERTGDKEKKLQSITKRSRLVGLISLRGKKQKLSEDIHGRVLETYEGVTNRMTHNGSISVAPLRQETQEMRNDGERPDWEVV